MISSNDRNVWTKDRVVTACVDTFVVPASKVVKLSQRPVYDSNNRIAITNVDTSDVLTEVFNYTNVGAGEYIVDYLNEPLKAKTITRESSGKVYVNVDEGTNISVSYMGSGVDVRNWGGYNQIQIDTKNDGETLVIKEGSRFEANGELYFVSEEDTEIEIPIEIVGAWESNEYGLYHGYLYITETGELTLDNTQPTYNPVLSGHYNGFNRALAIIQHESGAVRYKLFDSPIIGEWSDWIGDFEPYMVFQATSGSGALELEKGVYNIEAVGGGGGGGGIGRGFMGYTVGAHGGSGGNCVVFSCNISVGGAGGVGSGGVGVVRGGGGGGGGYKKIDVILLEKSYLLYAVGAGGAGSGDAGENPPIQGNNGGYTFVYEKFNKIRAQTNGNTGKDGSIGGAGGAGFLGGGAGGNGGAKTGVSGQNGLIRITKIG